GNLRFIEAIQIGQTHNAWSSQPDPEERRGLSVEQNFVEAPGVFVQAVGKASHGVGESVDLVTKVALRRHKFSNSHLGPALCLGEFGDNRGKPIKLVPEDQ